MAKRKTAKRSSPSTVRRQLDDARIARMLVRLERRVEAGYVSGYVCDVSAQLVLLQVVSDEIHYDGFAIYRLNDITRVYSPAPHREFVELALKLRKLRKPRVPRLDITSIKTVLASVHPAFPLVTVHREVDDPDVCHIGFVTEVTARSVDLLEITPDAHWDTKLDRYALKEISRVDLGGAYEEALHLVASSRV
jgi:hypothetical protein